MGENDKTSIEDCPHYQEYGYCCDCPLYGDGDEDWVGEDCPYIDD